MLQQTKTVGGLLIGSWLVFSLCYYSNLYPMRSYGNESQTFRRKKPENSKLSRYKGTEDYLINTAGCYIPDYIKTMRFVEATVQKTTCGVRAVFIEQIENNNIRFFINKTLLKIPSRNQKYECCYQYAKRSTMAGREDNHITYFKCTRFKTGTIIELKEEVIRVSCTTVSRTTKKLKFYEDAYIILKQIVRKKTDVGNHWNVLVVGMDTMSRARMLSSMPQTVHYFDQHGWLDYKGYQKVGFNTYPNLMAFLTGRNMSTVYHKCAKGMSECNDDIIWKKFQNSGFITAFGEDYLRLPDTFAPYKGFRILPTDHYMRPFFLTGENERGNLICTHKLPSAVHVLHYATQFVDAYKNNKFFGMFWINSYSHNLNNVPSLVDEDMRNFFVKLNKTGAFQNTFIFFLSDHGIRFGNMRLPVESYYEERLPMFFMWVPLDFRNKYKQAYNNLQLNQNRLTTPYDLHETFRSILQLSSATDMGEKAEACPECTSLFEEQSQDRTCVKARVDEKWCSCLNLTKVDKRTPGVARSVELAVSHIQNVSKSVKTKRCTKCYDFTLKKVIRAHSHVDFVHNTTNYVIAFEMSPNDLAYEASVQENNFYEFHIIQPTQTISRYNIKGNCVVHPNDRAYCVCEKIKHCTKN